MRVSVGLNDLQTLFPGIAAEWHPTKNGDLSPSDVSAGTHKLFWWVCPRRHEWQASVGHRTEGTGCPYCARKRVLRGQNDLASTHPNLATEWHPSKNSGLTPQDVLSGTNKKVWWLCGSGHEWSAPVSGRAHGDKGCPVCAGKLILSGVNDLATTHPAIAAQWHPSKNGDVTPREVIAGTNRKIWWLCTEGHEWQAGGDARIRGRGCPVCAGRQVLAGYNDLATIHPDLAAQWHPTKNQGLKPQETKPGSHVKVWWVCDSGHEWNASVANRAFHGRGCPVCAGRSVLPGTNDLATTHPELAAEWHPSKNLKLTVREVVGGTSKRIWWRCRFGHEWQARGSHRVAGAGCPVCAGREVVVGFNDLATTHPDIASEWHPSKNGDLGPEDVVAGTNKKLWWLCSQNHEWEAKGNLRVVGTGCPDCAEYGFKPQKPAVIYFLRHSGLNSRKIGITNVENKGDRIGSFKSAGWELIKEWPMRGSVARTVEALALDSIRNDLGLPRHLSRKDVGRRGGETETFSGEGPSDLIVVNMIQDLIHSHGSAAE